MPVEATQSTKHLTQRGMLHSVMLAGGFGSRLDAIADPERNRFPVAKPALLVGNLGVIEFSIHALRNIGVQNFNILTCHLPKSLNEVLKNGKQYGSNTQINKIEESPSDPLDTAGAVGRFVHENGWANNPNDIIVVLSADIIHNINLEDVIDQHLANRNKHGAVATIVVNPVQWDAVSRFGTVSIEGMPKRGNFETDEAFEDSVSAWMIDNQAACRKIEEFREKKNRYLNPSLPEDKRYQEVCLSNLNNSSIYVFNAPFFNELFPILTRKDKHEPLIPDLYRPGGPAPFSDFGRHVFKWLTERNQLTNYPVFAYILPSNFYWRDAGSGEDLRRANMDVLDSLDEEKSDLPLRIDTGIRGAAGFYWFPIENSSWKGENVSIHPKAYVSRSIISDNCIIDPDARIIHSVVGPGTRIESGVTLKGTVVFRKPKPIDYNVIGRNSNLEDCVVCGGKIDPDTTKRQVLLYEPKDAMTIGSLLGKTEYRNPDPKDR